MTDKEKAKQIAEESQILSDFPHDYHSVEYGAIEMAKWKEQQVIEKACEWLEHNFNMPNDFRKHFIKAMEE